VSKPGLAQGQVWWVNFPSPVGRRPALVLTRTPVLRHLVNITVAPITRTARGIPAEVPLTPAAGGVATASVVSLEGILTVPQALLDRRISTLSTTRTGEVFKAIRFVFAMPPGPVSP
jgi:mRNA interferase MazF